MTTWVLLPYNNTGFMFLKGDSVIARETLRQCDQTQTLTVMESIVL